MTFFIDPDRVTELAGKWGKASEGLAEQAPVIRNVQLSAQDFGEDNAETMAGVSEFVRKHATAMEAWGNYAAGYRTNLHDAVNSLTDRDGANAQQTGSVLPGETSPRDL